MPDDVLSVYNHPAIRHTMPAVPSSRGGLLDGLRSFLIRLEAHMPKDFTYSDEVMKWYSPQEIEDIFGNQRSSIVPNDYLNGVEVQLSKIDTEIGKGGLGSEFSDVVFSYLFSYPDLKRVVLAITFTRPCANGFGFARILLYQIAMSAYQRGFELHVDEPHPEMLNILQRSFGVKELETYPQEERYEGGMAEGAPKKRFRILSSELKDSFSKLNLAGLIRLDGKSIRINTEAFPTATELNSGHTQVSRERIAEYRKIHENYTDGRE